MKNCLVLGSGRSGTSMIAGTLSSAGYFMGHRLMPASQGNPKGCFESFDVQDLNEELLSSVVPKRPWWRHRWLCRDNRPRATQRWLAAVPIDAPIPVSDTAAKEIERLVWHEPYCFKDPRFSYTLPAWRPFLRDTVFVCVFRHPATTAASILRECADMPYLWDLMMDFERAVKVWTLMYRHIVERHRHEGTWLFMHYAQGLTEQGVQRLEEFIDAPLRRDFPDRTLNRSRPDQAVPQDAQHLYETLCALAGYSGDER